MDQIKASVKNTRFAEGLRLLAEPVLPLVSMVYFLYRTGPFATIAELIAELPWPIETGYAVYADPQGTLGRYLDILQGLEMLKREGSPQCRVVGENGQYLDRESTIMAAVMHEVLVRELEAVNGTLCGPCHCTLCCTGPDRNMRQEFFEIPLQRDEVELFSVPAVDTLESRQRRSMDEPSLQLHDHPFYAHPEPLAVHWLGGWSLILPRESRCPALDENGRCRIYSGRPEVCRRPQLFSYILEADGDGTSYHLRNTLLAVADCPYVRELREEIAAYAAASELHCIFRENKQ